MLTVVGELFLVDLMSMDCAQLADHLPAQLIQHHKVVSDHDGSAVEADMIVRA